MKLKLRKINLKKETLTDIARKEVSPKKFINTINEELTNIDRLLDVKIESLDEDELYDRLKRVFHIIISEKDYLNALSQKYNKHYTKFITIKTNMVVEEIISNELEETTPKKEIDPSELLGYLTSGKDNNVNESLEESTPKKEKYTIELIGASTKEIEHYDNSRLSLRELRKITRSNDFQVIKENKIKEKSNNIEKYENYKYMEEDIDINDSTIDEESKLFPYFKSLLKKDNRIRVKDILNALKIYRDELLSQARYIIKLSDEKKDQDLAIAGKRYKEQYNKEYPNGTKKKVRTNKHHKNIGFIN